MLSGAVYAVSTQNKILLGAFAGVFILFALVSAFVLPRRWPDFPGKNGRGAYIAVCFLLFFAMVTAVELWAVEEAETGGHAARHEQPSAGEGGAEGREEALSLEVITDEWKVEPTTTNLLAGRYAIRMVNQGDQPHDLTIEGEGIDEKTPVIDGGEAATLDVTLKAGTYKFYCSVPGHEELGMVTQVTVAT